MNCVCMRAGAVGAMNILWVLLAAAFGPGEVEAEAFGRREGKAVALSDIANVLHVIW